jgi:hypothetical protein
VGEPIREELILTHRIHIQENGGKHYGAMSGCRGTNVGKRRKQLMGMLAHVVVSNNNN